MRPWRGLSFWVSLLMAGWVFSVAVASLGLKPVARDFPLGVALVTLALLLTILAGEFSPRIQALFEVNWEGTDVEDGAEPEATGRAPAGRGVALGDVPWRLVGTVFGSLVAFGLGVLVAGFTVATPLFVLLFLRLYGGASWLGSAALAAGTTASMIGLTQVLRIELYPGILNGAQVPPF